MSFNRIAYSFFILLLMACSSGVKNNKGEIIATPTISSSEINDLPSVLKNKPAVNASEFGCKGDAVQLTDIAITGNRLSTLSINFSEADINKIFSVAHAGAKGEHLFGKITRVLDKNTVRIDKTAANDVSEALGSIGTDNLEPIQRAFDHAIQNDLVLVVAEGIYLIGEKNRVTKHSEVRINITKHGQNLTVVGAGKNKTIFRELDGKTQRNGRYTNMFYHYLRDTPDVGHIYLEGFSLDKNGRSITKGPPTTFAWEQAHAWSWAGHGTQPTRNIESITIKDIEIIDKIGAGINFSSNPTQVNKVLIDNITERNFRGHSGSIVYGERGDLEISCFSEDIKMSNLDLSYVQIEPVRKYSSNKDQRRFTQIIDSKVRTLEFTESDNKDPNYSRVEVKNVRSEDLTFRSIVFTIEDSNIKMPRLVNSLNGAVINSTIRLPYDSEKNIITPVNCTHLRTLKNVKNKVVFDGCNFVIDYQDYKILPKGFALTSSGKTETPSMNKIIVKNCEFDSRLEGSIDAYANGKWLIENNRLSGNRTAISTGGYRNYYSKLLLKNNNYTRLRKEAKNLTVNNQNKLWELTIEESLPKKNWSLAKKGSIGNLELQIKKQPTLTEN